MIRNEVEGNVLQETVSYLLLHYGTNTHSTSKLHEFNIIIIYLVTARATLIGNVLLSFRKMKSQYLFTMNAATLLNAAPPVVMHG